MTELVTRNGWLMPTAVSSKMFGQWRREAVEHIDAAMPFWKQRRCCVQAGGNLGIWPRMLVEDYGFDEVYTFEPDATNFKCLAANTCHELAISRFNCGLGDVAGTFAWARASEHKPGWHKVAPDNCAEKYVSGTVEVMLLDDICLSADNEEVDFLALDIEGYELEALKGAEATIARCRPVILIEDMGRSRFPGFAKRSTVAYGNPPGAVQYWLTQHGYRRVAEIKNDEVHAPVETLA